MFTLVIGGSASGKSEYAEQHVLTLGGARYYIATMQPFGADAQARIARHHAMRRGRGFETLECYTDLRTAAVPADANVLLEDLGNLTANEMFGKPRAFQTSAGPGSCGVRVAEDVTELSRRCVHLTVVTNEVFSGGRSYEGETLRYLQELACANRLLAARADRVVEVVCGLPNILR